MLRISSGQWKGRKLLAPEGELKPTSDKVRQALFSVLRPHIFGARFLDLFAGSGSVGLTALSEGASYAAFVEHDPRNHKALKENILQLDIPSQEVDLYKADAQKFGKLFEKPFHIIFADPFYPEINRGFVQRIHAQAMPLLEDEGVFILEHNTKMPREFLDILEGYQETKKYGDSSLSVFKK